MSNYKIKAGTLFESFGTLGDFTQDTGSAVADTAIHHTGSQSIKVTSASGTQGRITKTISADMTNASPITIWCFIKDLTGYATGNNTMTILFSNDSGFANYFTCGIPLTSLHVGWNKIVLPRTSFTVGAGSPLWTTTMVRMRINLFALASSTPSIWWDSIFVGEYSRPKCIFTFDDGLSSHYSTVKSLMEAKGWRGSLYIIGGNLGTTGSYMVRSQVQQMYDSGWDICNHTNTHPHLSTLSRDEQYSEILINHNFLIQNGWTRDDCHLHFAYPYGDYNNDTIGLADKIGFHTSVSTVVWEQPNELDSVHQLKRRGLGYLNTLATAEGWLDNAIARGGSIIFLLHKVQTTAAADNEWPTQDFSDLLDYIYAKRNIIDVVPITQWYREMTSIRKRS